MKSGFKKTMRGALGAVSLASVLACAAPAFAFAEETGGLGAIMPDMNEFIPMLVAFIIVVVVLAKFGWPIFNGIIVKRDETIKDALEKSEQARIESERLLKEYREQLNDARQEAATIVVEAKQSGELIRSEAAAKAQAEADEIVAKARQAIEAEKKSAIAELQGSVADLTVAVTAKIIGEDFSDEEHRKLIENSIAKAGALDA